jgi:hypothetical protein
MSIARPHLALVAGLCAALPLAACDKDDAQTALAKAHARMQGMAPGRQESPSPERNAAAYNEIITVAGKVQGSDAQNASAALLAARAKAGLAEPAAGQASALEADNQRDYQSLRALLSSYITAAARAPAGAP